MELIQLNLTINQIIEAYPETREVFVNNGFPIFADDVAVKELGAVLKLKTALRSKHINAEFFVALLEEKIREKSRYRDMETTVFANGTEHLNLLSLLPCPLKVPLQSELKSFLDYLRDEKNLPLNYCIESFFNHHLNYEDYLQQFEEPDEIPDVIMTAGYSFFYKNFMDRFVKRGVFADVLNRPVNSRLAEAGLIDPDGHFTVIAANILVMVVDKIRLGDLPMPRSWGDLLQPEYKKKVVIRGHDDTFCDVVQLNFYQNYGLEGIEKLGQAVRGGMHPAQMVKEISSSSQDAAAIYIMPYFFYRTIKNCQNVTVVWPDEGVLAYPVSVLIKADKMQELQELADYLTGPGVARICADAYFPAVHPAVDMNLPTEANFKWLGWDFIKKHDMEKLVEDLNNKFIKAQRDGGEI